MSPTHKFPVGMVLLAVFVAGVISVITVVLQMYNGATVLENRLKATSEVSQSALAKHTRSILEAVQVPKMYAADFQKVVEAAITGKYGKEGSKATFQMLSDANLQLPTELYSKLQRMIEAGNNEFYSKEQDKTSALQAYRDYITEQPRGLILGFLGKPAINLADYAPVTDERTETAFKTHKAEALKLN